VEDAAQDVWLVVARTLPQFRGESSVTTWLFGIARNVARNHRRLQRRKGCAETFDESLLLDSETDAGSESPEARAALRDIQLFMQTLEEAPREVFLCRFLLEMSPKEVAAATGLGVLSVYAQTRTLKASFKTWHQSQSGNPNETYD
jgi:RNA polymerase sigma-70 factor (ECF subfamily)